MNQMPPNSVVSYLFMKNLKKQIKEFKLLYLLMSAPLTQVMSTQVFLTQDWD